jgi:hypothetical protein
VLPSVDGHSGLVESRVLAEHGSGVHAGPEELPTRCGYVVAKAPSAADCERILDEALALSQVKVIASTKASTTA